MIAMKAILETYWLPTTNENWEELGISDQTWVKWKDLYNKEEKQARVKRQAADGHDQFGGDVLKVRKGGDATPGRRGTRVTIDELEGYFHSLATAAKTGKTTLDDLVKTNSTLTSSIAELSATNTQLTKEVENLSREVKNTRKGVKKLMT